MTSQPTALPSQLPVELRLSLRRVLAETGSPETQLALNPHLGSALGLDTSLDMDGLGLNLDLGSGAGVGGGDDEDADIAAALRALTPIGRQSAPGLSPDSALASSSASLHTPSNPPALSSGDVLASMHVVRSALEREDHAIENLEAQYAAAIAPAVDGSSIGARLAAAQSELAVLLSSLGSMRELAQQTEGVVLALTADIRKLDVAKANVVASMTALKRLQMLSVGVAQLAQHINDKQYAEAAPSLLAVRALQEQFSMAKWSSVEWVASLSRTADSLATQLSVETFNLFTNSFLSDPALGGGSGPSAPSSLLPSAARAMDALGPEAAASVLDWYATSQLREYRRLFRPQDEAGGLDNAEQRYRWYTRLLDRFDQAHAAAFRFTPAPSSPTAQLANFPNADAKHGSSRDSRTTPWRVDRVLTAAFAQVTRDDLKSALRREQSRLTVAALLAPMEATIQFEQEIQVRFHMPVRHYTFPPLSNCRPTLHDLTLYLPQFTELLTSRPVPPVPASLGGNAYLERISSVFEPYLSIFVDAQDHTLSGMLRSFRRSGAGRSAPSTSASAAEKDGTSEANKETDAAVLSSSTELFIFYRQALDQALRLSPPSKKSGAPPPTLLRELSGVFKKHLRGYANDVLLPALSDPPSSEDLAGQDDPRRARLLAQAHAAARILNTAAYCAETTRSLEGRIGNLLATGQGPTAQTSGPANAAFSLASEVEQFHSCAGQAINALLRTLEGYLEPAWAQLRTPGRESLSRRWDDEGAEGGASTGDISGRGNMGGTLDVVKSEDEAKEEEMAALRALPTSTYVDLLASALEIVATVVRTEVQSRLHVRVWCDKAMASVTQRLGQEIVQARPITPARATQLRRDALEIRTLLRELPPREEDGRGAALASYIRLLDRSWGRVNALLRVLAVPSGSGPDALVQTYSKAIGDRSMANFQKILEMRGARRLEQNSLNDAFEVFIGSEAGADLADSSFLTTLDLDQVPRPTSATPSNGRFATVDSSHNAAPVTSLGGVASFLPRGGGGEWHARLPNISLPGVFGSDAHSEEEDEAHAHSHAAATTPPSVETKGTPTFPDLRRFGTFLGALGRRRDADDAS